MVFRRRTGNLSRLKPVNRIKHVFDEQGGIVAGATQTVILADTTDTPTLPVTNSVETGSVINGFFLIVEAYARTAGALANMYMALFKNPGNNLGNPGPNNVGASDIKRYVIHQEMVMLQRQVDGNPRTVFKGVIAIPKGYRRNGPDDRWSLLLQPPGVDVDYCVQCHYKEFR